MRQAASAWERDYSEKLVAMCFEKGTVAPTVFFLEAKRGSMCGTWWRVYIYWKTRGPIVY